jgi:A/G-specific adenine glycosylase
MNDKTDSIKIDNIMETTADQPGFPPEDALLSWYDRNKRDLPWRRDTDPYHVWVSEIMLQQTRTEAVKGYYRRFMDRLPDIPALAAADEETCLKLWEGLGYYSRVRNMHKAAVCVMQDYEGEMPSSRKALLKLPGIGEYTASALASIAFGERTPAVDGNLLRVFSRMTHYAEDIKKPAARKAAGDWYLHIMTDRSPGNFNQALMDLGADICVPKGEPACFSNPEVCPWSRWCFSFRERDAQEYPCTAPKKSRRIENRTVFLIQYGGQIALRKRPSRGLLAGLWEFPNTDGHLNRDEALHYAETLGFTPLQIKKLPAAKHVFSHIEWHMTGYRILADEWAPLPQTPAASSKTAGQVSSRDTGNQNSGASDRSDDMGFIPSNVPASGVSDTSGVQKKPKKASVTVAGEAEGSGNPFASGITLTDAAEVRDHYSIPSAFRAYKEKIIIDR